jgi:hypothetical protein
MELEDRQGQMVAQPTVVVSMPVIHLKVFRGSHLKRISMIGPV